MKLSNKTYIVILLVLAVIFAVVYSSLYFSVRPAAVANDMWIFNTPDETANYFFIEKFTRTGQLVESEPLNEVSGALNLVHPRSTTVVNKALAPASFLGFILIARMFATVFTVHFIPFITPLASIIGVICFYLLVKEFFNQEIAFYSALLLLILPAFWYYNSRSLFNNVLFIDFLLIGFSLLISFLRREDLTRLVFSALFIGLALTIRTADLLWVGSLVVAVFIFNPKKFSWTQFFIFLFVGLLSFLPVLGYQYAVYGNIFTTGYVPEGNAKLLGENQLLGLAKQLVAPFGFNLRHLAYNFYYYYVRMFWWYFVAGFLGGALIIWRYFRGQLKNREIDYLVALLLVGALVLLYYGSWFFYNNLLARPLIGSSQVRYFLPLYILAIPPAVYFLGVLFKRFTNDNFKFIAGATLGVAMFYWSLSSVWLAGPESLAAIRTTVKNYHQINKQVRSLTETEAVIISSYSDKIFFPKRRVIFYWQDPAYWENIRLIAQAAPVYFYSIDSGAELDFITNNSDFLPQLVAEITPTEFLYKLN